MILDLLQSESGVIFALILSMLVTYIAFRAHFFKIPINNLTLAIPSKYPLYAFLLYFFASLFVGAILLLSFKGIKQSHAGLAIFQLILLYFLFVSLIVYLCTIKRSVVNYIFTGNPQNPNLFSHFFKNIKMGVLTYIVSYPVVLLVGLLIELISEYFWGIKGVNQVAVEQLKKTMATPWLFYLLSFTVIFIVPFMEELLFRGFLQSYFLEKWGRKKAITFTALFFAVFHFSSKQGFGNIQLIISLFILSLYLGFIYERQKSLWAPYGLHMTFNALSIIALRFSS